LKILFKEIKMKNKLLLFSVILLLSTNSAFSAGYCPTPNEYQSKVETFQLKALNMMQTQNASLDASEKLMNEMDAYMNSVFPGCIEYFQTTPAPDCNKVRTLSTSYVMLDKDKKNAGKAKLNSIGGVLQNKCPTDYKVLKFMTD